MTPRRIQLRRAKGWRMPPNTVSVARPHKWGNPYRIGLVACGCRSAGECSHNLFRVETPAEAVEAFRGEMQIRLTGKRAAKWRADLEKLRGKNLACWCKPGAPCHADVLLQLANREIAP